MTINNIQIAAVQKSNLNKKSALKTPPVYCIFLKNRSKERDKGGGVAFIIKDAILFQELKLKTSDKHLKVQAI